MRERSTHTDLCVFFFLAFPAPTSLCPCLLCRCLLASCRAAACASLVSGFLIFLGGGALSSVYVLCAPPPRCAASPVACVHGRARSSTRSESAAAPLYIIDPPPTRLPRLSTCAVSWRARSSTLPAARCVTASGRPRLFPSCTRTAGHNCLSILYAIHSATVTHSFFNCVLVLGCARPI